MLDDNDAQALSLEYAAAALSLEVGAFDVRRRSRDKTDADACRYFAAGFRLAVNAHRKSMATR